MSFGHQNEGTGPGGHVYGKNEIPSPEIYDGRYCVTACYIAVLNISDDPCLLFPAGEHCCGSVA